MRRTMLVCAAVAAWGCGLPRDPDGTLARVRDGALVVGVVESPPWAEVVEGAAPRGIEIELVQDLAAELDASLVWVPGTESDLLAALEHRELDLVVGGLDAENPWKSRVGLTRPYARTFLAVGTRGAPLDDLGGVEVAVRPGTVLAALIEREGGRAVESDRPDTAPVAAAAHWQLRAWGFRETGIVLQRQEQVVAVPPGENGWLLEVERSLDRHRAELPERVARAFAR